MFTSEKKVASQKAPRERHRVHRSLIHSIFLASHHFSMKFCFVFAKDWQLGEDNQAWSALKPSVQRMSSGTRYFFIVWCTGLSVQRLISEWSWHPWLEAWRWRHSKSIRSPSYLRSLLVKEGLGEKEYLRFVVRVVSVENPVSTPYKRMWMLQCSRWSGAGNLTQVNIVNFSIMNEWLGCLS